MALILPIMINQKTIGAVCVVRKDELMEGRDEYLYSWEVSMNAGNGRAPVYRSGHLKHNYSEGALVLAAKAYQLAVS